MEWVRERLSVIGYTNHVMSPEVLAQNRKSSQIPPGIPWGSDIKSSERDNPKIPDIFFSMLVSALNSTLYTGRTVYCYWLFHMLVNKLLELNKVLIHFFVAVSLRINTILTQYYQHHKDEEILPANQMQQTPVVKEQFKSRWHYVEKNSVNIYLM